MGHFINRGASNPEIAWLLFLTDPRVIRFVAGVGESTDRVRVFRLAWERNEGGWREEHLRRAYEMSSYPIDRESEWAVPEEIPCTS